MPYPTTKASGMLNPQKSKSIATFLRDGLLSKEQTFIDLKRRDIIKEEYCRKNKIDLITIKYSDKIDDKLNELLVI